MADKLRAAIALIRNHTPADCQWEASDINPFSGRPPAPEIATILNAVVGGQLAAPIECWRSIADHPPPGDGRDLLLYQGGWAISPIIVGRYQGGAWLSDCFEIDAPDQRPTHWMPLPEAPQ